jgi:hypothetical protein
MYLYLTTTGRVTGQAREIEIWFTEHCGRFFRRQYGAGGVFMWQVSSAATAVWRSYALQQGPIGGVTSRECNSRRFGGRAFGRWRSRRAGGMVSLGRSGHLQVAETSWDDPVD